MLHKNLETIYAMLAEARTKVMGILNVTPDSFSNDGVFKDPEKAIPMALNVAERFISQGVDIIDIGGESTRPNATPVDTMSEIKRVVPVVQAIRERFSIPISIDTTKSEVAREALAAGAMIVNDVSGLMLDPKMVEIVAESSVPVVIMHSQLTQGVNQSDYHAPMNQSDSDISACVASDLERLAVHIISRGVKPQQIILDPGIGFGKTPKQNLELIKNLDKLKALGYPVLLGASRKSFIGHLTGVSVEERLPSSLASVTMAVLQRIDIVRVHDVAETKQIVRLIEAA